MTFEEFWALYPRKVAKKDALKAWQAMTPSQRFAALESLPVHIRCWNAAGKDKEFLPYPATWCRGERWTDELEMPQAPENAAWWRTQSGIEAKARTIGMWPPRAGEDWHSLKARILAKERA